MPIKINNILKPIKIGPEIFKPKKLGLGHLSTDLHNAGNVIRDGP
jgi:hypothetical protein